MNKNIGTADRAIRILGAIYVAFLYFTQVINGTAAIILLVVAGVLFLTSFVGTCPVYSLFGIRTCNRTD